MKKRILTLLLAMLVFCSLLSGAVMAQNDEDLTLYGFRCYDDNDTSGSSYGFVSVLSEDPTDINVLAAQAEKPNVFCGTYYNGSFYGVDENGMLFSAPIDDYTRTEISAVITEIDSWTPAEMTYDYTTNTMYFMAIDKQTEAADRYLFKIDIESGAVTQIAKITGSVQLRTLAANPDGLLYGIDSQGDLYTVDKQTGLCTLVGSTGKSASHLQSMAFNRQTGELYWAQYGGYGYGRLVKVNPATGEATDLGILGANAEISGLFFATDAYRLTFEAEEGGLAESATDNFFNSGDKAVLKASADKGYTFGGWGSENGGTLTSETETETTFTMPESDVVMHAYFVPDKAYLARTIRDATLGIAVEGKKMYYNTELIASEWDTGSESYAVLLERTGKKDIIEAYDLRVESYGAVSESFKGKVEMTFKMNAEYEGKRISVYTYEDGKISKISAKVKDGELSIKLPSVKPVAFTLASGWGVFWVILFTIVVACGGLFVLYYVKVQSIGKKKKKNISHYTVRKRPGSGTGTIGTKS